MNFHELSVPMTLYYDNFNQFICFSDDSLGYEFPFTLCIVSANHGKRWCGLCPWNKFCRGCSLPKRSVTVLDVCLNYLEGGNFTETENTMTVTVPKITSIHLAIDWDQTALHLRYQSSRERAWIEDDSIKLCRRKHTEPVDLDHCLSAFTSEERLEEKYHCSSCKSSQPATKKLQIWKLPPILVNIFETNFFFSLNFEELKA